MPLVAEAGMNAAGTGWRTEKYRPWNTDRLGNSGAPPAVGQCHNLLNAGGLGTCLDSQGTLHSRGLGGTYLSGFICVRNRNSIWGIRNVVVRLVLVNILEIYRSLSH